MILIISTGFFSIKSRRKTIRISKLKRSAFRDLENCNLEGIDPKISLNEQANLLKYDKQFEFPANKLSLGDHLGSGAFGIVRKAIAKGIFPFEKESTVAVKMIKSASNYAVGSHFDKKYFLLQHLNMIF